MLLSQLEKTNDIGQNFARCNSPNTTIRQIDVLQQFGDNSDFQTAQIDVSRNLDIKNSSHRQYEGNWMVKLVFYMVFISPNYLICSLTTSITSINSSQTSSTIFLVSPDEVYTIWSPERDLVILYSSPPKLVTGLSLSL